jgi:hypothetical protein
MLFNKQFDTEIFFGHHQKEPKIDNLADFSQIVNCKEFKQFYLTVEKYSNTWNRFSPRPEFGRKWRNEMMNHLLFN